MAEYEENSKTVQFERNDIREEVSTGQGEALDDEGNCIVGIFILGGHVANRYYSAIPRV